MTEIKRSATAVAFMQHVGPIKTWGEWLKLVSAATTFEQKLGLLHAGFDVEMGHRERWGVDPDYIPSDRLKFYFSVADGWPESTNFQNEGVGWQDEPTYQIGYDERGRPEKRRESQLRQSLARKAFDMLVSHYFLEQSWLERASYRSREDEELIRSFLGNPGFLAIQQFFRVEEGRVPNLSTHDEDNRRTQQKKVREFLLWLPPLLWNWTEEEIHPHDPEEWKDRKMLDNRVVKGFVTKAKLWMIEVLSALGKLDLLGPWILELDKPCLAKLKEIALGTNLPPPGIGWKGKPVTSIEEACFYNSGAAWLLKKHEVMMAEHVRLQAISDAEREIEAANRKVAALTQSK